MRKKNKKKRSVRKTRSFNLKARITSALRKIWLYSPIRKQALEESVDRGLYKCSLCLKRFPFKKQMAVDHVEPAVSTKEGFIDWNTFIDRLFCPIENLAVLCHGCHDKKTEGENKERRRGKRA